MKLSKTSQRLFLLGTASVIFALAGASAVQAKQSAPEVSPEGMVLQKSKDAQVVYLKPGATFDKYDQVAIIETYVEFSKDWQRDYNNNVMGLQGRVSTEDMDRMKSGLAAEFKKVFTQELEKNGGYNVVAADAPGAANLLILRPAIVNLQVSAPDLKTADMRTTLVRSAGQMTIYLELWDSATNTILARIIDAQADEGMGGIANRASNKAAADDILQEWAVKLRKSLDATRGKTAAP